MLYPFIMIFIIIASSIWGYIEFNKEIPDTKILTNKQNYTNSGSATNSSFADNRLNELWEYNNEIDWYNLSWNYKLVLKVKEGDIKINFLKTVWKVRIAHIPWIISDSSSDNLKYNRFEDVITRKVIDWGWAKKNPSWDYTLTKDDFFYTAISNWIKQLQSNDLYEVDSLKLTWLNQGDYIYLVFDDIYTYKITGNLMNWINNELGDIQVIENNTFTNATKDDDFVISK